MLRILTLAALSLVVAGCGPLPQRAAPDTQPYTAMQTGVPVTAVQTNVPVTGRDWNCRGCY